MKHFFNQGGGYKAPKTASVNQETPFLSIGGKEGNVEVEWSTQDVFPLKVVLRAKICPIFLHERGIQSSSQLRINGQTFSPKALYGPAAKHNFESNGCEAIELRYDGKGSLQLPFTLETKYFNGLDLGDFKIELASKGEKTQGSLIYRKPFAYQHSSLVKESRLYLQDGRLFHTPPGRFGIERLLRPHSGSYKPGSPIETMQQIYYDLTENEEETIVNLTLSNDWLQQKKISFLYLEEAMKLKICFWDPPTQEEGLNLSSALQEGYGSLTLHAGDAQEIYVSVGYQQPTDDPSYLDVFFAPKGEVKPN
ncbi:MAG: hypothetical protein ACRCYZ_05115 [Alphaproteobacteria bacterium]